MRSLLTFFFTLYLLNQNLCFPPEITIDVTTTLSSTKVNKVEGSTSNLGKSLTWDSKTGFIIESSSNSAGLRTAYITSDNALVSSTGTLTLDSLNLPTSIIEAPNIGSSQLDLSVASGDVNGDGHLDYIIGDPSYSSNKGIVYVIYGGISTSPFPPSVIDLSTSFQGYTITGENPNDLFGYSVSFVNDVNGDTIGDFLIGAPFMNGNQGAVYVIFGSAMLLSGNFPGDSLGSTNMGIKITGEAALSYFGYSVGPAGNFDLDLMNRQDFIIGAYGLNSNQGAAYVIYGSPSLYNRDLATNPLTPSDGLKIKGASPGDNFGWSVSKAGDVNGDHQDDVIIGAPRANFGTGAAYIIYGKTGFSAPIDLSSGINSDTGVEITSQSPGSLLGFSVAVAGNMNGDGFSDVIIGAPGQNNLQGAAYVVYGKSVPIPLIVDSLTYDEGFAISTSNQGVQLGYSVSTVGRFNSHLQFDGVIVSAPYASSSMGSGAAYIVFGFIPCSSKCAYCNPSGMCQVCKPQYAMQLGQCVDCPETTYPLNSACKSCSTGCSYCQSNTICTQCSSNYYLYQQQCYQNCPSGTYTDGINCVVCPEDCHSSCISPGICLPQPPTTPTTEYSPITESQIRQANVSAAVFDGASLVGNSLCIGSSLPTNFGLVAKIIRNIRYLNVTVSPELQATFYVWKTQSKFLSAPSSWNQKFDHKSLPLVFERYGLSSVFLVNYWRSLIMTLIGFALFIIFKLLESTSFNANRQAQGQTKLHTISKTVNIAASNFALSQIYGSLDDIFFFFIIEVQTIIFESGLNGLSFALAIILLIFALVVLGAHVITLIKYQRLKNQEAPAETQHYFEKYLNTYPNIKMIYADFKDLNLLQQNFLLIHVIRCIFSNIITTTLYAYPLLQTLLLVSSSIAMITYLVLKKPFKVLIKACSQYFCETILLFVHFFMLIMAIMNEAESQNTSAFKVLSKFIIVFNLILLFGSAVFMIVELLLIFYTLYKEKTATPSKTLNALPNTLRPRKIEENITRPPPKQDIQQEEYPTNLTSYPFKQDYQHLDSSQNQTYLNETIIQYPQYPQNMHQEQLYFEENSTQSYQSPEKNILDSGLSDFQSNFFLDTSSHSPNLSYSQANSRLNSNNNNNNPLNKRYNKRIVRQGTQQRSPSPQIHFEPELKTQTKLQEIQHKISISSASIEKSQIMKGVKAPTMTENFTKRIENRGKRNDVVFEEIEEPNWQSETKAKQERVQNQVEEKPKGAYDQWMQRMQDDLGEYGNQKEGEENPKEKKRVVAFWNK